MGVTRCILGVISSVIKTWFDFNEIFQGQFNSMYKSTIFLNIVSFVCVLSMCSELTFVRNTCTSILPIKGTIKSAGFDLFADAPFGDATKNICVKPFTCEIVSTGISVKFPSGFYGKIEARSSSAIKQPLTILAGVIDEDYTGEIKICVYNLNPQKDFVVKYGDCFAQLVLIPYYSSSLWLESICFDDGRSDINGCPCLPPRQKRFKKAKARDCDGFGSTDVKQEPVVKYE